jgi:cell division protease FtsH
MEYRSQEPGKDENQSSPPRRTEDPPSVFPPHFLLIVVIGLLGILVWTYMSDVMGGKDVEYSVLMDQLRGNNVESMTITGKSIEGKWRKVPGKTEEEKQRFTDTFRSRVPDSHETDADFQKLLTKNQVKFKGERSDLATPIQIMLWLAGPAILVAFLLFMMRRSSDPMGTGFLGNFGRSPAKRFQPSDHRTTFKEVAAMEQAKSELMEVVEFLKNPAKFQRLGAQIPKGVLLIGPPGTGKTLLARATAGEAGVPFFSINGSEFIQMFVGVGASRVRDLFQTAKEHSPCIIFVDEIDAVGRHRGAGMGGGHDEREQTLNQILSEMDGFEQTAAVIVLAATNRPDVLDPALLRPGRFDRHVTIDRPTKEGRVAILKVHTRKVPLGDDIDLAAIAGSSTGFSGAELKNLVNEAALLAVRANKNFVTREDFESARDRVLMGSKREEVVNPKERRMTAYHEAGHALAGWFQAETDKVHKVSIIPRGRALGVTQFQPDEDRLHTGERRLHAELVMFLAGRAAEKLVFDEYSAGAESDLSRATQVARSMVAHWGMSPLIGPVALRQGEEHPFLGKELHHAREFSDATANLIDTEIARILRDASNKATEILVNYRSELDLISDALLERETLNYEDLVKILGEPVKLKDDAGRETIDEAPAPKTSE